MSRTVYHPQQDKGGSAVSNLRKWAVVSGMALCGLVGMGNALAGEKEARPLPEGIRGFKGIMIGTITSKAEKTFVLKVEKITRVWRHNEAKDPESVLGKEVPITLWEQSRLAERHRETFAKLKKGDRVEVEAFHLEGDRLAVVEELKKVEAAAAFPQGIRGFRGVFVGTLVEKGDTFFTLNVARITKVWKESTATNPACAVGKNVKITLRREGRLAEALVKTLATLKPGDRVLAEAFHVVNDVLAGVEQLKRAE